MKFVIWAGLLLGIALLAGFILNDLFHNWWINFFAGGVIGLLYPSYHDFWGDK